MRDCENASEISNQLFAVEVQSDRSLLSSLESSRNTVAKLDMVHTHAAYTLNALAEQSDKLDTARESICRIEESVKVADSKVKQLDRLKGWLPRIRFQLPDIFRKDGKNASRLSKSPSSGTTSEDLTPHSQVLENIASDVSLTNIDSSLLLQNDALGSCPKAQANKEIDQNLDTISNSLKMLKLASMAMSLEIEAQNEKIDALGNAAERVSKSISNTNGNLKSIS